MFLHVLVDHFEVTIAIEARLKVEMQPHQKIYFGQFDIFEISDFSLYNSPVLLSFAAFSKVAQ